MTTADHTHQPRYRLLFLDGIRGLAALYVVLYHFYCQFGPGASFPALSPTLQTWTRWMNYGHYSVDIFIVLSGYSLMVPVARSTTGELPGGTWAYIKRRARRILPPYYAAFALALLPIALSHLSIHLHHRPDPTLRHDLDPLNIASHLVLLHNLDIHWINLYDPPIWTIATEWQIYFFLPWLLLPIWRRFGTAAMVAVAFALPIALHYVAPPKHNFDYACPWFLGLFALGAAGAVINFRHKPDVYKFKERCVYVVALLIGLSIFALIHYPNLAVTPTWYADALVGLATVAVIVYFTHLGQSASSERSPVLKLLESRACVVLGTFSYSLYLTHAIVMTVIVRNVLRFHLIWAMNPIVFLLVGLPIILIAAYLFHLAFERRFMPGHPHTVDKAARAAAVSPAP